MSSLSVDVFDCILCHLQIDDILRCCEACLAGTPNTSLNVSLMKYLLHYDLLINNTYGNRLTFLIMYLLTPSSIDKNNVKFLDDEELLQSLVKFCEFHNLDHEFEFTISYTIWNLVDIYEFLLVINYFSSICCDLTNGSSGNIQFTFNIELDFDQAFPHRVNLNSILNRVFTPSFSPYIKSINVTNFTGPFKADFSDFKFLKQSTFINSNARWFRFSDDLVDLHLFPKSSGFISKLRPTTIKSLPMNLKVLTLGNVIINAKSLDFPFPKTLESISLTNVRDLCNGQFIYELISKNMESKALRKLCFVRNSGVKLSIDDQIMNLIKVYLPNLQSYLFSYRINGSPVEGFNIESQDYRNMNSLGICHMRDISLPRFESLVELDLSNNNIEVLNFSMSPTLKKLVLSYNPLDWTKFEGFPPNLIRLELIYSNINDFLPKIKFPEKIQYLSMEVNNINSIDYVKFPRDLKTLGIGCNRIKELNNHCLPPNIDTIHLTKNLILTPVDFTENALGQKMNIRSIFLNGNCLRSIKGFKFPETINLLNFDDNVLNSLKDVRFCKNIQELSFVGCYLSSIERITFEGEELLFMDISQNKLKTIRHLNFPNSIKTILMNYNRIDDLPMTHFQGLSNLKTLEVSHNYLKSLNLSLNENLKLLNVSDNNIKLVNLKLNIEKNKYSRLSSVNLSKNQLTDIHPENLGSISSDLLNLIELDISGNHIQKVDWLQFPSSLQCVIYDLEPQRVKEEDDFVYDERKNIITNDIFFSKRI